MRGDGEKKDDFQTKLFEKVKYDLLSETSQTSLNAQPKLDK
jgi:hypothetical protein